MTKEKITNGKYWLVIAKYPFPGFETYTLIKSDKNPEYYYKFNKKIVPEIIEDCFDQYNYIDYPDPYSYETEEDYQEDVDHWLGNKDSINIECKLITKELIEDIYGKDYYDLDVSEPDYDLTL